MEQNTANPQSPSILIVGSGPAGLITALALQRSGVSIRIIDRKDKPHGGIRGTAIQPRSLETLEALGVLDEVLTISTPPYTMAIHGAGKEILSEIQWAERANGSPGIPYDETISLHQSTFEEVLRRNLRRRGIQVEWGVELVKYDQDAEDSVGVRLRTGLGETHERYKFVIAADGAKGSTRRMLGLAFVGKTDEVRAMYSANVECTDIDREHWHRWGEFNTKAFFLKPIPPAPLFQIQALGPHVPASFPDNDEGMQKLFDDISHASDIRLRNVSWVSEWKANVRMVDKFSVGRVFLVGDAAHCHSPAGGQGTNSGIMDAFNLSWKLTLVLKHGAALALLDTYHIERMPVIAEMLDLTQHLYKLVAIPPSVSALEPRPAAGHGKDADDPMWRPKTVLQLGINCRWSPIVFEGRALEDEKKSETMRAQVGLDPYGVSSSRLRAGDRAPDAPLLRELSDAMNMEAAPGIRLFQVFQERSGAIHSVLVFANALSARDVIEPLGRYTRAGLASLIMLMPPTGPPCTAADTDDNVHVRYLVDTAGHAYSGYEVQRRGQKPTFVVVRPDGMIGAYATSIAQVHVYFAGVLGKETGAPTSTTRRASKM
ncbi:FAD/NAD-P-binding domain-containing protein [Amylostereum chailletii]|nr:FAD/NAD-P-binding domain-containing protein [Amylostereum chailletii]